MLVKGPISGLIVVSCVTHVIGGISIRPSHYTFTELAEIVESLPPLRRITKKFEGANNMPVFGHFISRLTCRIR